MEGLAFLRSRVYERNKYDAGWGAADGVSVAYVLGHTCAVDTRSDPHGRKQTDARSRRDGEGYGRGSGDGEGDGNGGGYGYGYGDPGYGLGHCLGHGHGNGCGHGYGHDYHHGNGGHPWKI